jgi:NTP pyrophosphatase (non-canonical NTP hydrolase)
MDKLTEYQTYVHGSLHVKDVDAQFFLNGLMEEVGETAKKMNGFRVGKVSNRQVASDVADCLWYLTMLASELGFSLEDLMAMNVAKLTDRKLKQVISKKRELENQLDNLQVAGNDLLNTIVESQEQISRLRQQLREFRNGGQQCD